MQPHLSPCQAEAGVGSPGKRQARPRGGGARSARSRGPSPAHVRAESYLWARAGVRSRRGSSTAPWPRAGGQGGAGCPGASGAARSRLPGLPGLPGPHAPSRPRAAGIPLRADSAHRQESAQVPPQPPVPPRRAPAPRPVTLEGRRAARSRGKARGRCAGAAVSPSTHTPRSPRAGGDARVALTWRPEQCPAWSGHSGVARGGVLSAVLGAHRPHSSAPAPSSCETVWNFVEMPVDTIFPSLRNTVPRFPRARGQAFLGSSHGYMEALVRGGRYCQLPSGTHMLPFRVMAPKTHLQHKSIRTSPALDHESSHLTKHSANASRVRSFPYVNN